MTDVPLPPKNSKGTILLVANFAPDEGFAWWLMENFWIQLARLGREHGLEPLLIYRDQGVVPAHIRSEGIPTAFRAFLAPESSLRDDLKLVLGERVRLIYLTDRAFFDPRYALLRTAGVRRIITHDHVPGDPPEARGFRGVLKAGRNRLTPATADLMLAVSPFVKQRAIQSGRIPPSRVKIVQNGIRPLPCGSFPSDYARQTFAIPAHHTICVMAGRAHRYKRVDFLIQIAKKVHEVPEGREITFLFCGDGPDLGWLQEIASAAGLGRAFIFGGRREDLHAILCSCDLAFHPSRGEAFSLAMIEYMSAGLPVIAPDIPSVSQAITPALNGFIYPDGDDQAAVDLLLSLHRQPSLRDSMGKEASKTTTTRYSFQAMNAAFRSAMNDALP